MQVIGSSSVNLMLLHANLKISQCQIQSWQTDNR